LAGFFPPGIFPHFNFRSAKISPQNPFFKLAIFKKNAEKFQLGGK
jgi:hypothetical protein